MTSLFATPDPDLEDQQVISDIHETRASLADYLRPPKRWNGLVEGEVPVTQEILDRTPLRVQLCPFPRSASGDPARAQCRPPSPCASVGLDLVRRTSRAARDGPGPMTAMSLRATLAQPPPPSPRQAETRLAGAAQGDAEGRPRRRVP